MDATAEVVEIRPQPGPQEAFLASPADIAIAGGAAGGGKTFGLLMEPLRHLENPDFGAVIFRRTYPQITNEGGIWDESFELYPLVGGDPREGDHDWIFPAGSRVRFAHMQHEKDKLSWKGAQIPLIGFDQLEDFTEGQFFYMLSRNRSTCGVAPYIRATCNPVPDDDPIGGWLARFIAWWIDQESGYPIQERSGALRWFVRVGNDLVWADSREELLEQHPGLPPKSVTFIPAKLEDNPILEEKNPEYRANLLALPLVERERLLGGNWKIRPSAGKVFNRDWFEIVPAAPAEADRVRAWDKAATKGAGDWTAGVRMARTREGVYYVEHVVRVQLDPGARDRTIRNTATQDGGDVQIMGEQEPGAAGKSDAVAFVQLLEGFTVHTQPSSGDKVTRAGPFASAAEAGNVKLVAGDWNEAYLKELHSFPDGDHDDQVDGSSLVYNRLALKRRTPITAPVGTSRISPWTGR